MEIKHLDKEKDGLFEAYENNLLAGELHYNKLDTKQIALDHTEVKDEFKGKGIAKELVVKAVEYARSNDLKIVPVCPYVVKLFSRSNEFNDVKA